MPDSRRLLRRPEVEVLTALSRSSLYKMMREGNFPEPIWVGLRAVRWRACEVEDWVVGRPRAAGESKTP